MSKTKVAIQVLNSGIMQNDPIVMLGDIVIKHCKIPVNQTITLKIGALKHPVKVISVARYNGMRLSESMSRKLGLHQGALLRLHYRSASQTLHIGPLIGVMVSRYHAQSAERPFGTITSYCKELVDAAKLQGAFIYFFTPDEIGSSLKDTIEGWSYSNRWYKSSFPIPDVVHNRLTSRKLENKPSVQQFMKEVKARYGTQIFNEKYLDKNEVFQALKKDSSLLHYLPESYPFRNYAQLAQLCQRHPVIFLKPIKESLGKGIIRIIRQEGSGFVCHFATASGTRRQSFASLPKCFAAISGRLKIQRHQIQQGLTLIESGGNPVDFRALTQKNGQGKWAVTSIVARIAGNNHFVSNLARGGSLSTVKEIIPKSNILQNGKLVHDKLRKAALDIAAGLEKQIPSHFGEFGIDLAVDRRGRVWLIEVNSKPSKNDNTPLHENKIRPSVLMMVQYARHLAGY